MYKLKSFCSQQITIGKVSFTTVVQNFQEHWMLNKKKNVLAFHKKNDDPISTPFKSFPS